jgi:hypothetical protein
MTVRMVLAFAILVITMMSAASAQSVGARQITGRVTDGSGAGLPGVGISATGPGRLSPEMAVTDIDGRFVIRGDLQPSPATYTITARLPGFETVTVLVRASEVGVDSTFTIRMHIGCYGPGVTIDEIILPEIDGYVSAADVIALLRLESIDDQYLPRIGDGYCGSVKAFRATIIDAVRDRRSPRLRSIQFVLLAPEENRVYRRGDNYIALLQWHPVTRAYRVMSRAYFMPVRTGQVSWPGSSAKSLADVLATLRSMSQR